MADDQGQDPTANGQDPETASNTSTTSASQSQDTGNAQDAKPKDGDPKAEDELRRARDEAAKYRTSLREAQQALKDAQAALQAKDDEGKSELQKAMDRVADLEGRSRVADSTVRDLRLQNAVLIQATKLDIVDPDAAFRLIDRDTVDYDGDKPTNVQELLEELIEDRPYLKAEGKKDNGSSKGSKPSTSTTQPSTPAGRKLTLDDIQKMSPDEVNERWDEVKPVLAASKGH